MVINGLTNYWDFNNDYYDKIGQANLYEAVNVYFVNDRNGRPNSAIYINNGNIKIPNGYYFSGVSSMTAWVNANPNGTWINIINFAGDPKYSIFFVQIRFEGQPYIGVQFYNSTYIVPRVNSATALNFNSWYHLAITVDGSYYRIYINGLLTAQTASNYLPEKFLKYSNFIGGSRKNTLILDQLKFFNRGLSLTEIRTDMNVF